MSECLFMKYPKSFHEKRIGYERLIFAELRKWAASLDIIDVVVELRWDSLRARIIVGIDNAMELCAACLDIPENEKEASEAIRNLREEFCSKKFSLDVSLSDYPANYRIRYDKMELMVGKKFCCSHVLVVDVDYHRLPDEKPFYSIDVAQMMEIAHSIAMGVKEKVRQVLEYLKESNPWG